MSGTAVKQVPVQQTPPRILLVTKDQLLQHKLSRILANQPCHFVHQKPAGPAGRELSNLPDAEVVLLDICASITTVLHSLGSFGECRPTTRIVLIVPESEMYFWTEVIRAGAWECLPKPVEEAELQAVLLNAL